MTRDEFLKRLARGLSGLPAEARNDIVGDYAAHFDAAAEEGRPDAEVAEALGDPARLARELRLEAGIRRWEEARSPSSAWAAVIAFIGLGAIDIMILLPILLAAIGVLFGLYAAAVGIFIGGGGVLIWGPFGGFPGGPVAALLTGLGLMAAAIALAALTTVATIALVNAVSWFGRLHYRVLHPTSETDSREERP